MPEKVSPLSSLLLWLKQLLPSLLPVGVAVSILILAVYKSNSNFEGSLTVTQMSFTAGVSDAGTNVLLNSIKGANQISVQGLQTFRLRGRFGNEKFSRTIEFRSVGNAQTLLISPATSGSTNIDLQSLTINGGTRVAQLQRLPGGSGDTLGMCLYQPSKGAPAPEEDANCKGSPSTKTPIGKLHLNVGGSGVRLSWQGSQVAFNGQPRLFYPESPTMVINVASHSTVHIGLPRDRRSSSQWIWARGEVRDLGFYRYVKTNFTDQGVGIEKTLTSTIVSGNVRGFSAFQSIKQLNIESGQLLLFGEGSRLSAQHAKLRSVELAPWTDKNTSPGLAMTLVGKETILRTGTDSDYPIAELWISSLEQSFSQFPKELFIFVIIGAAGFLGGFVQKAFDTKNSSSSDETEDPKSGHPPP
jgi:hypothetical protein